MPIHRSPGEVTLSDWPWGSLVWSELSYLPPDHRVSRLPHTIGAASCRWASAGLASCLRHRLRVLCACLNAVTAAFLCLLHRLRVLCACLITVIAALLCCAPPECDTILS